MLALNPGQVFRDLYKGACCGCCCTQGEPGPASVPAFGLRSSWRDVCFPGTELGNKKVLHLSAGKGVTLSLYWSIN